MSWSRKHPSIPAPPGHYGCTKCRQVKPLSEFQQKADGKSFSHCKVCRLETRRAARKAGKRIPGDDSRFWAKVNMRGPEECWNWISPSRNSGYGYVQWRGFMQFAHRVSWELAGGTMPKYPIVLDHICRNTLCVNPAHLRIVTQAENCGPLAKPTPHWTNKTKTVCKRGHPFSGWMEAEGKPTRVCLICWPGQRRAVERFKAKYGDRPLP